MKLGYVMMNGQGVLDSTLADLAKDLLARGLKVRGVVQINTEAPKSHKCDMDVSVLPAGPVIRISQTLGEGAVGCRLDPDALEQAVSIVSEDIDLGADLLLLNKFGKHEAEGRGFREVIGAALANDIPVLVGVNGLNLEAFQEFAGGLAQEVTALTIFDWLFDEDTERNVA